jgi:hypothetical protein
VDRRQGGIKAKVKSNPRLRHAGTGKVKVKRNKESGNRNDIESDKIDGSVGVRVACWL